MNTREIIYMVCYLLTILYLSGLGGFQLLRPTRQSNEVEQERSNRISTMVGVYMLAFALACFLYMPPIMLHGPQSTGTYNYHICTFSTIILMLPSTLMVMRALLQRTTMTKRLLVLTIAPEILLLIWYALAPQRIIIYILLVAAVLTHLALMAYFVFFYQKYLRLLKTEYADLSQHNLHWGYYVFGGFTIQGLLYAIHEAYFTPVIEYVYMVYSLLNCTMLVIYSRRLRPISIPANEMKEFEQSTQMPAPALVTTDKQQQQFAELKLRLQQKCEETGLYRNPNLTRDMLCKELGINRNILARYFQESNQSYYQYINGLRIQYACELLKNKSETALVQDIANASGYTNLSTFRKAFREVVGCLPSQYKG